MLVATLLLMSLLTAYGYYFSRMESTYGFEGWMDEIRFTGHVLDSSKFVRFEPISGMTIIFR